jgi:hypothetical protein
MALRIVRNRKPEPPPEPDKPKRRVRFAGKAPPAPVEPQPEPPKPKRRVQIAGKTPVATAERTPEPSGPKRRVQVAGRKPAPDAERGASPRRSVGAGRPASRSGDSGGGWIKWAVLAVFVAVAAIALGVCANRPRGGRRRALSVPDHYRGGSDGQDRITRSMGGKSMEEWCRENEKDNEMVQGRRSRRSGR